MKDKQILNNIIKLTGKNELKKENWFKDLKNYQADDRILKDREPVKKK